MLTMLRNAVFIWPMVSWDVICAVPLQLAPAMFWLDAHILRASSSTVWACTSKRPAMDRISCGSVIKRVGMKTLLISRLFVCVGVNYVMHTLRPGDEQTASYA